jgi:hypothetical protein
MADHGIGELVSFADQREWGSDGALESARSLARTRTRNALHAETVSSPFAVRIREIEHAMAST